MIPKLLMLVVVLVTALLIIIHESHASFAKPGCQETCGNLTIPYPFGIGTGCYLYKSFEVMCSGSSQDPTPLRFANNHKFPILELSMDLVRVIYKSTSHCSSANSSIIDAFRLDQFFFFLQDRNRYVAVGCGIFAFHNGHLWHDLFKCSSLCSNVTKPAIQSTTICTGSNGCCQLSIPETITSYSYLITHIGAACSHALVAEKNVSIALGKPKFHVPVALNWVVSLTTCDQASKIADNLCGNNSHCLDSENGVGYICRCRQGYIGNPYLSNGCQDINVCPKESNHYCEKDKNCVNIHGSYKCASPQHHNKVSVTIEIVIGVSAFGALGYWTYIKLKKIEDAKLKKKFFRKNGGHLLKKQIYANKSCVMTIRVYTAEEIEKATKNFSRSMFLGKGGQGTVYKGLLPDGTVVAVKKSNVVDVDQVERFVNEVFVLAQINHRNIVKLFGCCLEYEVPLLVYEYLANDTLSQHLHDEHMTGHPKLPWKDRTRIAREVAGALAYLHSYASPTILHRDIKPGNILLDQNYKAVVSDFGLSRLIPPSKSHLTTQVEGTFGYLDPEYFKSGQLTTKSDVYSFGVLLTELLTRKKSISSSDSGEGLVPRFNYLLKHNRVVEILDKQVVQEAMMDDVVLVAKLATRCTKTNGKKRPSMEEVVTELDKLKSVQLELAHKCNIEHEPPTIEL